MTLDTEIKQYWEQATPMSFAPEQWSWAQKWAFRYGLQDYMQKAFEFNNWSGKKILEIGCGSGIDAIEFARNGAIVTATDITDNALELTRQLANEVEVSIETRYASALDLPFSDNYFDCVYSFGVLHHIPDIETALREICRVLKSDGTVMVMLYHRHSLLYAYSILLWRGVINNGLNQHGLSKLLPMYSERIEGCPYTVAYTKSEALNLFSVFFDQVEVSVHYNVIDTPEQRKVKLQVDDKYELGWHLVVKGIKP